jgi:hypothetical protein
MAYTHTHTYIYIYIYIYIHITDLYLRTYAAVEALARSIREANGTFVCACMYVCMYNMYLCISEADKKPVMP